MTAQTRKGPCCWPVLAFGTKLLGGGWDGMAVQCLLYTTGSSGGGKGLALREQVGLVILRWAALTPQPGLRGTGTASG